MASKEKIFWYVKNVRNLLVASVRILFYCLRHPEKFSSLAFSVFSTLNEFYQASHGRLYPFEETRTYRALKENKVFAQCNYFNSDPKVARPIETQVLGLLTKHFQPKTIFEIGTYNGFTAMHFATNSSDDTIIYTLDLPLDFELKDKGKDKLSQYSYDDLLVVQLSRENVNNRIYRGTSSEKKIKELFGNSIKFDFSAFYNKVDLVYIDGSHAYEYVKSDTENALKMLSKNGVIIWHDFDYIIHRDVFKYLNSLVEELKIFSIPNTRFAIYGHPV